MKCATRIATGILAGALLLTSCGGNPGGGMGEFTTVSVVAKAGSNRFESDVLTGNTCPTPTPADGLWSTDNVDFTITSALYPGITSGKRVFVNGYNVSFSPANSTSPGGVTGYSVTNLGWVVPAGGSITIPVAVATDIFKATLVNQKGLQLCSSSYYEYYVTVTFSTQEEGSWVSKDITATMNVAFADRSGS